MRVVIKLGGYLFPSGLNIDRIQGFSTVLKSLRKRGHRLMVVTGGGINSRMYIDASRRLGSDESYCDDIGIRFTRINALLLIAALGDDAYPEVPENMKELRSFLQTGKIVVMGGLQPGQSTNAVAAIASEATGSEILINATDVDGVYNSDPKLNKDAKKLDAISVNELLELVVKQGSSAGGYKLLDPAAVKTIERSKISTVILNATDPENIRRAVEGKKVGTRVTF